MPDAGASRKRQISRLPHSVRLMTRGLLVEAVN